MSEERKHRYMLMIFKEILEAIESDDKPTISRISMLANVPYSRLKKQLKRMAQAELVTEMNNGGKTIYRLTPKGKDTLKMLREVHTFLSSLGLI